jgi:hypothetical protein
MEDTLSDDEDESLREAGLDLDAWQPEEPPRGFVERVMSEVMSERASAANAAPVEVKKRHLPSARRAGIGAGALAIAAGVALWLRSSGPPSVGEATAAERTQVAVGARASAVLEPGAHVKWSGDDVTQDHGDVFYRVEPGAKFNVHTPAGDVTVHGTCFRVKVREGADMNGRDVKAGVAGAVTTALAFVAVYEGKVSVSRAGQSVALGPGESAQSDGAGVRSTGDVAKAEKDFDSKTKSEEEALGVANKNLVDQVREYQQRLTTIEEQKKSLERRLATAQDQLAAAQADGSVKAKRFEFDLSQDDWAELAKTGTIKYRIPCLRPKGWFPSESQLLENGLGPQDGPAITEAYKRSYQRVWSMLRPLCAQALGSSSEVADKVPPETCIHLVQDISRSNDREAANEGMRQAAEIRAGQRPMPSQAELDKNPTLKMFLALTAEPKAFEQDLAQTFGPEEAHRLAYGDGLCMGSSTFGGPGPREKK